MNKPLTPQQRETARIASETISNLEFLLNRPEFKSFLDRFRRQSDDMADSILHDDMSPEEREKIRQKRLAILEVLKAPSEDIQACRNTLKGLNMG